jgi:hypothetical protein
MQWGDSSERIFVKLAITTEESTWPRYEPCMHWCLPGQITALGYIKLGQGWNMTTHLEGCDSAKSPCDSGKSCLPTLERPKRWRRIMPAIVTIGLLIWLVYRISPQALVAAASQLDWPRLCLVFSSMVLALYLWDSVCLHWLFAEPGLPLSYGQVLRARGSSYVASAVNFELGQGLVAWELARAQGTPLVSALGRCVLLAVHDVAVLLTLGLIGSLLIDSAIARGIMGFCAIGLAALVGVGLLAYFFPRWWRERRMIGGRHLWPGSWTWGRSLQLSGLRGIYFAIILAAVALGLEVAPIPLGRPVVLGAVPVVLLADGLPISVSGLGTRETALMSLIRAPEPGVLLAFSLVWSAVLITGRLLIGLGHWWLLPAAMPDTLGPFANGDEAA